jgi:hypothetical protein
MNVPQGEPGMGSESRQVRQELIGDSGVRRFTIGR